MKLVRPATKMPFSRMACAVLTSALEAGVAATANLKHYGSSGWETDTEEVQVYTAPGITWGSTPLPIGTNLVVAMIDGMWIVINAACPEEA